MCLFDFILLLITLLLTDSSSLHARKNNFPIETVKHSFTYRESLRHSSGVTEFGPFERFFPFGGLRSITRFLDSSDDVGR